MITAVQQSNEIHASKRHKEVQSLFRTAYTCVKEHLSFSKYEVLCQLQKLNGLELGDNYCSRLAGTRFIESIADTIKVEFKNTINDSRFISLLSDGSTDKGIVEEEIIYVRLVKDGVPQTKFVSIEEPSSPNAEGITNAIKKGIASLKPSENESDDETYLLDLYKKLINVNFDGAAVMSGVLSGVQKRLKDVVLGLIYTHCVAHRLELAMLDALKLKDTYIQTFDNNINALFKFYYYSPVRRKELKEMAKEIKVEFKQFGLLKNIRWLASRSRALSILENNYKAIIFDLETKSYGKDETASKARGFLQFLKKPTFLFYLHFFQDFVVSLKELSLIFQKNELLVCEIPRLLDEKISNLEMLSVVSDGIQRLIKNLSTNPNKEIVYGSDVVLETLCGRRDLIDHNVDAYVRNYSLKFKEIILETQIRLRERFRDFNETCPLREICALFDFKLWPKSFSEEKTWGLDMLGKVLEYYVKYKYITEEEARRCKRQWPLFRTRVHKHRTDKVYDVYVDLLKENEKDIDAMLILLTLMMTISSSTCQCERGFSCMNQVKTKDKISMTNKTLNGIMEIAVNGPDIADFNPELYVNKWMASGKRRLQTGHLLPSSKKQNSSVDVYDLLDDESI